MICIVIITIMLAILFAACNILLEKARKSFMNNETLNTMRIMYLKNVKQTLSIIIDIPNRTDLIQLSIFAVLPNESIIRAGIYLTYNNTIRINMNKIFRIYKKWARYLINLNDNVKDIDIGLITILTAYSSKGVFTKIYVIPLNLYNITFKRLSVVVYIKDILTSKDMIISSNKIDELIFKSLRNITREKIDKVERYHNIVCARSRENYTCIVYFFIWNVGIEYTNINTTVPLLAVKIGKVLRNINKIIFRELLETDKDTDILFSVDSLQLFAGYISHVLAGPLLVLHGSNIWLNYTRIISKVCKNESIIFVGFRGDLYFLKYNLYYCYYVLTGSKTKIHCKILNTTMLLSFAIPYIYNNSIYPTYGYLSNNFTIIRKLLNSSQVAYITSRISINLVQTKRERCVVGLAIIKKDIIISLREILKVPYIVEILSKKCSFSRKTFNINIILSLSSKYRVYVKTFYINDLIDKYLGYRFPIHVTYIELSS